MSDCITGTGYPNGYGYLMIWVNKKRMKEHRHAWIQANGDIPAGLVVDHTCHNPKECVSGTACEHRACINVEHMRLVTQQENIMAGKHNIDNRSHCNQGHPFVKENIMIRKNGKRECAECNRIRARKNWANRKVVA